MDDSLFMLIIDLDDDQPLMAGHDHTAAPSLPLIIKDEDMNMGDEAFVNPFDTYDSFEDVPY